MPTATHTPVRSPKATIEAFFAAFGAGDLDALVATFAPEATITAVRASETPPNGTAPYGTYHGHDGVRAFVTGLGRAFDTKAFAVDNVVGGDGAIAFANGSFTHILRATGRSFESDWALMCRDEDGLIVGYHFYEDSAAYLEAASDE